MVQFAQFQTYITLSDTVFAPLPEREAGHFSFKNVIPGDRKQHPQGTSAAERT
jgi:hypothetical protein